MIHVPLCSKRIEFYYCIKYHLLLVKAFIKSEASSLKHPVYDGFGCNCVPILQIHGAHRLLKNNF
jgi:hypothetical protein